ncbi:MAG TPA: amidase [Allosphingosinicella sp.]|nr:amidase [Allosphingosinicella sp.]
MPNLAPPFRAMIRPLLLGSLLSLSAAALAQSEPNMPNQTSAEARTRAALDRVRELNPRLNAVIAVDPTAFDQARALDRNRRARGPLFGMPILIKDNIETLGPLPTTAGSLALANNVTGRDAPLVARLRAAGAVILGKTNLSEWANIRSSDSISGWSAVGGQVRNPYALNRNPCGSSSGSAVAVASGMVPAAIGTETDGSVTCPAAINGIIGFKPSVGLVSRTHVVPISHSQDTPGPMTLTVRDAALIMNAIVGADPADPATAEANERREDYVAALRADALRGVRLGVMRFSAGFGTDAPFEAALDTLRAQGAILVEITEFSGRQEIGRNEIVVLRAELKHDLNLYLATLPETVRTRTLEQLIAFNNEHRAEEMPLFGQDVFETAQATPGLDAAWRTARETSLRLAGPEGIDRMLREHNVVALIAPTRPAAWLIDSVHGDTSPGGGPAGSLAAVAGYPHLTVPMGQVRGLPVGLSFIGAKWSDARILALGYAYEQASHARVPPRFLPSIEESEEVAPHLRPAARP